MARIMSRLHDAGTGPNTHYNARMSVVHRYLESVLELLVAEDYVLVLFSSMLRRDQVPPLLWMRRWYQMIDRKCAHTSSSSLLQP